MELDCKSVQMPNVQWAKVGVESIIEESVVNGKINRRRSKGDSSSDLLCPGGLFLGRLLRLGRIWERCVIAWRLIV